MLYCIYPLGHLLARVSAAPTELILLLLVFPQGFISGFALISPWAMQECRPYRAHCILLSAFPQGFISGFALIPPWATQECRPYRALCILLSAFTQGFISGFALISPWALQECRPCRGLLLDWLVRFGVCKWIVAFVRVLFDCIVCGIGGDWCGQAMSPNGAILFHSPGRKPWANGGINIY